jgi:hypothetical protein
MVAGSARATESSTRRPRRETCDTRAVTGRAHRRAMNTPSGPRTSSSVSISCPWCDAPLAVEDAFTAPSVRCDACATSVDFAPVEATAASPLIAAAA